MKKVIGYMMYLLILLLGSSQFVHANTSSKIISDSPSWDFVKKHQVKVKCLDSSSVLIEDADLDLDEEFHSGDNLDNGNANNYAIRQQSLFDSWYLTFSSQFLFRDYSKQIKISTTPCGYSSPIYLSIGVFRI